MHSPKKLVAGCAALASVSVPAVALAASTSVAPLAPAATITPDNAIAAKLQRDARQQLIGQTVSLARTLAKLQGHHLRHGYRHAISSWSDERLLRKQSSLRRQIAAARRAQRAKAASAPVAIPAILQRIAMCESGGNPRAIGGGGAYRGKYQFDYGTWASVGGHGDPAAAPESEQDRRAMMLYQRSGTAPWPVCGR
jgi:hypothetical protein